MVIEVVRVDSPAGQQYVEGLRHRFVGPDAALRERVATILAAVRERGDAALLEYCRRFDAPDLQQPDLRVSAEEFQEAAERVEDGFLETLRFAVDRIRSFHQREMEDSWMVTRPDGVITGRLVRPVDSAGLYVPGGQGGSTPLVSSVLMNGIPAAIAGVGRRVMVTPPDASGRVAPALLVAAREVGITEVYKVGSAWGIGALAFGTDTVPAVDVIVGPGNQYVAEAKRQIMGRVRIDMLAGPSEVLILADDSARAAFVAADMLAQAEHDPQALALLITPSVSLAAAVEKELVRQVRTLDRQEIAQTALARRGRILLVDSLEQGMELANQIGIEHLELQVTEPWQWLPRIRHAGAVFLGSYTPEAAGDYVAGPNHVLPTMGMARIASALGVETFLKKSSIISYSRQALAADSAHITRLAALEGLTAHGRSVTIRLEE